MANVNRWGCNCCQKACPAAPTMQIDDCGWELDKGDFHADIRAGIPDVAEDMLWLKKIMGVIKEADSEWGLECVDAPNNWRTKNTVTKAGVFHYKTKDPETLGVGGDCVYVDTCGGTDTETNLGRGWDACDDPPDNTLVTNSNVSGDWAWVAGSVNDCVLTLTGTDINGDPISRSLVSHGVGGGGAPVYSAAVAVTGVVQTASYDWDDSGGGDYAVGTYSKDTGFKEPYFGYELTIPDHEELKGMEVEWEVFFTPDGGVEGSVEVLSETWVDGDDSREFMYSADYPNFGQFRIGNIRYRCGPGFWTDLPDVP